jgi:hypothetical protein
MTDRELNRAVAEKVLGCRVQDATFYDHCTCVGYIHGSLGQVPRLSWYTDFPSALRVAREAHRRFGLVVGAHLTGREICEAALAAAEAWEQRLVEAQRVPRVSQEEIDTARAAARDEMLKEAPQTYAGAGRDVSFSRPTEAESERRAQQAATAAEHADTTRKFSNLAAPESFARGGPCPYVIPDTCEITAEMAEDASPLADALDKAGTGVALLYASIVRNESRAEFLIALGDILTALRAASRAAREEGR